MKKYVTERDILELSSQVEMFMKYIDTHEIPNKDSRIRFSDINPMIVIDLYLYPWMISQLHFNLNLFQVWCSYYQEKYPNAYLKIGEKIEKRKNFLSREKKVQLFMEYIEEHDIPSGKKGIRFCDIFSDIKNTTDVGIWVQDQLEGAEDEFFKNCSKYQDLYPNAYLKLLHKLKKRNGNEVEENRLKLFMQYIEEHKLLDKDKLRFCDLDPSSMDKTNVSAWANGKIRGDFASFENLCREYKDQYSKAYLKILKKFAVLQSKREIVLLSDEERLECFLKYLNVEKNPLDLRLNFRDMDDQVKDTTMVLGWLNWNFSCNIEEFEKKCSQYQEKYPIGYDRLMKRKENFSRKSFQKQHLFSYEEKMECLLKFLNDSDVDQVSSDFGFCDICDFCLDSSNVRVWVCKNLYVDLGKFIFVLEKYREIYPIGYEKVERIVNASKVRLRKERLLLLNQLRKIRDLVQENSKTLSKVKK